MLATQLLTFKLVVDTRLDVTGLKDGGGREEEEE